MTGGLVVVASLSAWAIESQATRPPKSDRIEEAFRYDAKGRRDPFVSLVREGRVVTPVASSASPDGTTPILYGIVWDPGGRSLALINDTEVQVGGMIGKYRVEEIRRDAVVLAADLSVLPSLDDLNRQSFNLEPRRQISGSCSTRMRPSRERTS